QTVRSSRDRAVAGLSEKLPYERKRRIKKVSAGGCRPFWIEVADQVEVPAFITGGLHDIFQRGEPLLYEQLKDQVNAKLQVGNWANGKFGSDLRQAGVPALDQIGLCGFDHYLKGIGADVEAMTSVNPYIVGEDWIKTLRAGGFLICVKKKMFFPGRGTQNGRL